MSKKERKVEDNINIGNARIGFRNFSGKAGQYNNEGNRNFVIFIDDYDLAKSFEAEGWNIRWLKPRDEGENDQAILPVKVAYGAYPPKIILVKANGKQTPLYEENVQLLDWADIESVDITVRPYNWHAQGKSGVKAYLKIMYVRIQEDPWEDKFTNPPDSAQAIVCDPGFELVDGECRRIRGE